MPATLERDELVKECKRLQEMYDAACNDLVFMNGSQTDNKPDFLILKGVIVEQIQAALHGLKDITGRISALE